MRYRRSQSRVGGTRTSSPASLLTIIALSLACVGLAWPPAAAAAARRGPRVVLHARSRHTVYTAGQPVQLDLTLLNHTGGPAKLAQLSTGSIVIDGVRRIAAKTKAKPVRVAPDAGEITYDDGLSAALLASLRRVPTRSAVRLTLASDSAPYGQALDGVSLQPDRDTRASLYSLAVAGRYRVTLHYRFPERAARPTWYAGTSSRATVTFRVRAAHAKKRSLLLLSRSQAVTPTGGERPPAHPATIRLFPGYTTAFQAAVGDCINQFRAPGGDPDNILPTLLDKSVTVFVGSTNESRNYTLAWPLGDKNRPNGVSKASGGSGEPTGSVIGWNPNNLEPYTGTDVARDPCASLYHEFFHAYQNAHGTTDRRQYDDSHIPTREVHGVRAENDYRKSKGLKLRDSYDGLPLPLPLTTPPPTPPIEPPPTAPPPAVNPCSGVPINNNQPCFLRIEVNGDQYPGPDEEYGVGIVTLSPGTGEPTIAESSSPAGGFRAGSPAAQYNNEPGCWNGDQSVGECYQFSWRSPQTITLTAHPAPIGESGNNSPDYDSAFAGWGGDCASAGTSPTCTLAIGNVKGASGLYSLSVVAYFQATDTAVA